MVPEWRKNDPPLNGNRGHLAEPEQPTRCHHRVQRCSTHSATRNSISEFGFGLFPNVGGCMIIIGSCCLVLSCSLFFLFHVVLRTSGCQEGFYPPTAFRILHCGWSLKLCG